jgi:hypothetical protein
MVEHLIERETALLAKEKGFNWSCNAILNIYEDDSSSIGTYALARNSNLEGYQCTLPSQSYLQKWIRETHDIHIINSYVHSEKEKRYEFIVFNNKTKGWGVAEAYKTYEEGFEDKLREALKNIS